MKKTSICSAIMLFLLTLCVVLPLAFTNTSTPLFLDSDNRNATEFPSRSEIAQKTDEIFNEEDAGEEDSFLHDAQTWIDYVTSIIDGYIEDRIGFRTQAMAGYALGNDVAFHVMTHPDYAYGEDGWLYHSYDFYVAPDDYLELYSNYVVMLSNYCKERGITFLYVNTPSKEFVYDEHIPSYVPTRKDVFDVIQPIIDDGGVEYLDLTDSLREAKEEGTEVFHQFYDPGHFNTQGAFIASNAILERLSEMGVDVEQADLSDYDVTENHVSNLPASVYPIDMDVEIYQHKQDGTQAVDQTQYKEDLEVSSYSTDVWNWENASIESDANLLMFQGSYFCSQGTSLYNQFPHAALVRAYINVLNAAYYIDVFQPNVVVFEAADYTVRDGYYDVEDLEVADLPPVLSDTYDLTLFTTVEAPVATVGFDSSKAVANLSIPCDTENIRYAYVVSNGVTYDCLVREDDIHWGVDTSALSESQQAQVYCVGVDGQLQTYSLRIVSEEG